MNKLRLSIFALCALSTLAHAQVYSPIVGFNTITALGNSDTRFSVPLHRPSVYEGLVQSVSGSVITVQGLPGWILNQFVYSAGSQTNSYYASVRSGNKEGMYYTVTANSADSGTTNTSTLNVDTAGDVIDGGGIAQGDSLTIIPYWTLATLFSNQTGVTTTSSISGAGSLTRILIPDLTSSGVDLAATVSYYYYNGTGFGGAGWRRSGGGFTNKKDDDAIAPDSFILIRQDGVASSSIMTATGAVGTGDRRYIIGTISPNTAQDNAIAIDIPVPLSLTQSNLFESGAFVGTSSISGATGDKLLVFDDASAGIDKAAIKSYYYYTGTGFTGPGWRLQGGGFSSIRNAEFVFQPGSGYIIRKEGTAVATTTVWTIPTTF